MSDAIVAPEPVPAVRLEDVVASSGDFRILKGVTSSIQAGRTTVIMGTAGSGKSTFLKVAAGLTVPDEGRVFRFGEDISRLDKAAEMRMHARAGFVFQDAALWANQTIWNNVLLPLSTHRPKLPKDEAARLVRERLEQVGYTESVSVRPAELSTGEQKLIGTARALILDPEFVFMDEPTASIDDAACERFYRIIMELKAKGVGMAIVTHSGELAQLVADRLVVVRDGLVAADGEYDDVTRNAPPDVRSVIGRLRPRG